MRTLVVLFWCLLLGPFIVWMVHEMGHQAGVWQESPLLTELAAHLKECLSNSFGVFVSAVSFLALLYLTLIAFEKDKPIDHDACDVGPDLWEGDSPI